MMVSAGLNILKVTYVFTFQHLLIFRLKYNIEWNFTPLEFVCLDQGWAIVIDISNSNR